MASAAVASSSDSSSSADSTSHNATVELSNNNDDNNNNNNMSIDVGHAADVDQQPVDNNSNSKSPLQGQQESEKRSSISASAFFDRKQKNKFGKRKNSSNSTDIYMSRFGSGSKSNSNNTGGADGPLPRELKRILQEVAKTGSCSWLSWDQDTTQSYNEQSYNMINQTGTAGRNTPQDSLSHSNLSHAPLSTSLMETTPSSSNAHHLDGIPSSAAASASFSSPRSLSPSMSSHHHHTGENSGTVGSHKFLTCATGGGVGPLRQPPFLSAQRPRGPPRKKHRNGLHKGSSNSASSRMRFGNLDGASSAGGNRKRPYFSTGIRNATGSGSTTMTQTTTAASTSINAANHTSNSGNVNHPKFAIGSGFTSGYTGSAPSSVYSSAPSSIGSGRTSGSEPDDSTQYECDSEGTSATTNSEVSVERLRKSSRRQHAMMNAAGSSSHNKSMDAFESSSNNWEGGLPYKNLQSAFRIALGLVLDHFYQHRGGYKLSPAEKRRNETLGFATTSQNEEKKSSSMENIQESNQKLKSEDIFLQRRQRLMRMLQPSSAHHEDSPRQQKLAKNTDDPPFTIQRIAEVLVAPERYYSQTHKLCNCLEKLLLVTSSTEAFGGITGGDTPQSRKEERELAALAVEKNRQEIQLRQRRLRKRTSSPTDEFIMEGVTQAGSSMNTRHGIREENWKQTADSNASSRERIREEKAESFRPKDNDESGRESSSREMLEAAARASLRTKFDHVGIDPHSMNERDVRAIAENRRMTNSPPPPNLGMSAGATNMALPGHSNHTGFVRHPLSPEQNAEHHNVARVPSPILFSPGNDSTTSHLANASNMHMLQSHHAVALAGASLNRPGTNAPLDYNNLDSMDHRENQSPNVPVGLETGDMDARSSASNSDVDSESDDLSLDDSASDRSDGSDPDTATQQQQQQHYEPFTAARAMALNRMQQQQRLQQSRGWTTLSSLHQQQTSEGGYRPPADSEYQSGDSIDSTRAEDSGGSDSSSSDLAD